MSLARLAALPCLIPINARVLYSPVPSCDMDPASELTVQGIFDHLIQGLWDCNPGMTQYVASDDPQKPKRSLSTQFDRHSFLPRGNEEHAVSFVSALSTTMSRLSKKVHSYISEVRVAHNARRSIHLIPVELFTRIIYQSLEDRSRRVPRLRELTAVCSTWRETIHATPTLWSKISLHESHEDITAALRNSVSSLLDFELQGWEETSGRLTLSPSVDLFMGQIQRWRTARLNLLPASSHLVYALAFATAPHLELLEIKFKGSHGSPTTGPRFGMVPLFDGVADRLRVLHLAGIGVQSTLPFMTQLSDLQLGDSYMTAVDLLNLIQRNHNLRRLSIRGMKSETADENQWPPISSTRHEGLATLEFGSHGGSSLSSLLPYLDIPSCSFLSAALEEQPASGGLTRGAEDVLHHMTKQVLSISQPVKKGELIWVLSTREARITLEYDIHLDAYRMHCSLPSRYDAAAEWIRASYSILSHAIQDADVTVEFDGEDEITESFSLDPRLIQTFSFLHRVRTVIARYSLSSDVIRAMSHMVDVGGSRRWLFDEMETLIVEDVSQRDINHVLDMIRRRYGVVASPADPLFPLPHLPRRLRRLELPSWAKGSQAMSEIATITCLDPVP